MKDYQFVECLLIQAGKIALHYFGNATPTQKEDLSFVTKADIAIQSFLCAKISFFFPNDGMIGEEQNLSKKSINSTRYWVIDPIDGTDSFINGFPTWGISIGVVEDENPVAGFFYMPITKDFFSVLPSQPVLRNGQIKRLRNFTRFYKGSILLSHSRLQYQSSLFSAHYPGKIQSFGSVVTHLCYLATGSADAVFVGRARIWDIIVGLVMLNTNGGEFQTLDGKLLDFQDLLKVGKLHEPMLVGHPNMIEQYRSILKKENSLTY